MSKAAQKQSRRIVIACMLMVIIGLVAVRIWQVNRNALSYPTVHHDMGEWVELDGAFLNYLAEDTDGYAIRVTEATIMSPNEYVERYGEDPDTSLDNPEADSRTILRLTVEMRNSDNDTGGFFIQGSLLAPEKTPVRYIRNGELWHESNRNIDASTLFLRIIPGTTFTLNIPFEREDSPTPLEDKRLSFVVSTIPVRHVIDVEVDS